MLNNYSTTKDKNTKMNFDSLFSHLNRYYLGSMTADNLTEIDTKELPFGAMVYDKTNHKLKVLSEQSGKKKWKPLSFS